MQPDSQPIEKLKILIADDHSIFRIGLVSLLKQIPFVREVRQAENGAEALDVLEKEAFDVLLLDIEMPVKNGIETLKELRQYNDQVKVLPLSMSSNEKYLAETYERGANGYLLKNTNKAELKRALELVMEGESYYTPEVAGKLFKTLASKQKAYEQNVSELTDREREILKLMCQQFSSSEIAEQLFISEHTVKTHRKVLIAKLKVKNSIGLVLYAIKNSIFLLD